MSREFEKMREWMEGLRDAIPAERIDEGYIALTQLLIRTKRTTQDEILRLNRRAAIERALERIPQRIGALTRMEDGR